MRFNPGDFVHVWNGTHDEIYKVYSTPRPISGQWVLLVEDSNGEVKLVYGAHIYRHIPKDKLYEPGYRPAEDLMKRIIQFEEEYHEN
jgi:hypothetical protein